MLIGFTMRSVRRLATAMGATFFFALFFFAAPAVVHAMRTQNINDNIFLILLRG